MSGPVIVLGWDGLDIELLERYELGEHFGQYRKGIGTHVNPVIDEPHTRELWPSMITGTHPDTHGIHAATESGVAWDSSLLRYGSQLATKTVPDSVQSWLGKKLRERGVGLDSKTPAYYDNAGIETVFDDGGRAISIPNYETDADRARGLDGNRDTLWATLQPDKSLDVGMAPGVDRGTLYNELGSEVGMRLGETIAAITSGEPLVWTWFGLLDTIGHMEPAVGESAVKHWYEVAATVTEAVRQVAPDTATVVAVSDHGIQDGTHQHYATICSDDADPIGNVEHVFDVAEWVQSAKPAGGMQSDTAAVGDAGSVRNVQAELEALGYV